MSEIHLSSAYLAPIEYYAIIAQSDFVKIEACENYQKQSFRNRAQIMDALGPMNLTIPIDKDSRRMTSMKDVKMSNHNNWQHVHWNAIISSYNSSPFFEYYKDSFYPFYHNRFEYLYDFNTQLNELILSLLDVDSSRLKETDKYENDLSAGKIDLRNILNPKVDYKTELSIGNKEYYQLFNTNGFIPSLSIIDLIFNMGNESVFVLMDTKFDLKGLEIYER